MIVTTACKSNVSSAALASTHPAAGPGQEDPGLDCAGPEAAGEDAAGVDGGDAPGAVHHLQGDAEHELHQRVEGDVEEAGVDEAADTRIIITSAANRLIGEVVQSRRRPLLGPSPG